MKEKIEAFDYAAEITKALRTGVLLTTKADGRVNTMTIGWGMLGVEWSVPIFTVFVREHRFTRFCLDKNPEFTINVPMADGFDKRIIAVSGTKSGRDTDKISELGLHLEEPEAVSVPAIRELPLTLECRVLYSRLQDRNSIPQRLRDRFYPQDVDSLFHMCNKDFHIAYYGEIVSAYIVRQ